LVTVKHSSPLTTRYKLISILTSKSHLLLTPLNVTCDNEFRRFRVIARFRNNPYKNKDIEFN
jgi:hypothetical protein